MSTDIKIIIIEDNESDADLLHRELKKSGMGFTSVVVQTKESFEDALQNFDPDIIISDYSLPSFDAVTAFRMQQEKAPFIPFIIISGIIGEENVVELIKNGVTDYVQKENIFTIVPKINRALRDSEVRKEKIITNEKLRIQTDELIIANIELGIQNDAKRKRAEELIIANKELAFQNEEKEKRAEELIIAYKELKQAKEFQEEYIRGLEAMMFMTSHKLRVPITNILGLAIVLDPNTNSPEKIKRSVDYIKKSANILDTFTRELAAFMEDLKLKEQYKS